MRILQAYPWTFLTVAACGMRRAMKTFRHDEPETSYMHLLSSVLSRRMSSITRKTIAVCCSISKFLLSSSSGFLCCAHNNTSLFSSSWLFLLANARAANNFALTSRFPIPGRYLITCGDLLVGVEPFFSSSCSLLPFSSSFSFASSRLFSSSKNLFPCSLARLLLLVDPPVLPETTLLLLPFSGEGITTLRLLNLLRSEDRRRPRAACAVDAFIFSLATCCSR
mmetsp:Transcript_21195/g.47784  ORF Transcript_21195/g.47784 Transcript_21195/m.47784 type:complete len:223 (+) Transcript_21195:190-858(+)